MTLCLLVTMLTVTGLMVTLFQKTPDENVLEALVGTLIVWFPAAGIHLTLFSLNVDVRRRRRPDDEDEDDRGRDRRQPEEENDRERDRRRPDDEDDGRSDEGRPRKPWDFR